MLDRIQNINYSKPYGGEGGSSRSSDFEKYLTKPFVSSAIGKDSIIFSPAALYLARLNWHLHEIEYKSSDKILIDIFISDYEFISEFDFSDFYTEPFQLFNIIRKTSFGHKSYETKAKILYKKDQLSVDKELGSNSLYAIEEMFSRIGQLKLSDNSKKLDAFFLSELVSDIERNLANEFKHVLNQMHTFLTKLDKFYLKDEFKFKDSVSELVIIEDISTIYG